MTAELRSLSVPTQHAYRAARRRHAIERSQCDIFKLRKELDIVKWELQRWNRWWQGWCFSPPAAAEPQDAADMKADEEKNYDEESNMPGSNKILARVGEVLRQVEGKKLVENS